MKELLYLKDEQIKDLIEQLFYAYRETFPDLLSKGTKSILLLLYIFLN